MSRWHILFSLLYLMPSVLTPVCTARAKGSRTLLVTDSHRAYRETGNTVKGDPGCASPARTSTLLA